MVKHSQSEYKVKAIFNVLMEVRLSPNTGLPFLCINRFGALRLCGPSVTIRYELDIAEALRLE